MAPPITRRAGIKERNPMYQLMVSYDCGMYYRFDSEAETLDELRPRMDELNGELLRWYVEKDGDMCAEPLCGIHASIFAFMDAVRGTTK